MHLIVGLGNPGEKYARNRHNVGMLAIDQIAQTHNFSPFREKFQGQIADGLINGERCLLLKPSTFMNKSGDAVAKACNFYKLPPQAVTVIYDELDLAPGKVRVKRGGGNGGHNGLRSIDPQIGLDYLRVRVGIGHPGNKNLVSNYVLSDFAKNEAVWLTPLLDAIAQNALMLIRDDGPNFMNKLAIATGAAQSEKAPQTSKKLKPSSVDDSKKATKIKSPPPEHERKEQSADAAPQGAMADMLKKLFGKT